MDADERWIRSCRFALCVWALVTFTPPLLMTITNLLGTTAIPLWIVTFTIWAQCVLIFMLLLN